MQRLEEVISSIHMAPPTRSWKPLPYPSASSLPTDPPPPTLEVPVSCSVYADLPEC